MKLSITVSNDHSYTIDIAARRVTKEDIDKAYKEAAKDIQQGDYMLEIPGLLLCLAWWKRWKVL